MSQTEFEFPEFEPPNPVGHLRRSRRASSAIETRPRRSQRRPLSPQTARLEICAEAFEKRTVDRSGQPYRQICGPAPETGRPLPHGPLERRGFDDQGLVESVAVLLATIAFGLGWAALELGRVEPIGTGYDPARAGLWEMASTGRFGSDQTAISGVPENRWTAAVREEDRWIDEMPSEWAAASSRQ